LYLAVAALSIIGSICAGLYTKVTRVAPEKAGELATAILDIGERIEHAASMDALDALQDELETILRNAVIGLREDIKHIRQRKKSPGPCRGFPELPDFRRSVFRNHRLRPVELVVDASKCCLDGQTG
jgi:uncharacterized protein YbjQ (UPF0145 family)